MRKSLYTSGLSLIEVVIGIVIVIILATIVAQKFSSFRQGQALSNSVDEVIAIINEARSRTLSGENGQPYGVHLQSDRAVLFAGTTYVANNSTNKAVVLDSAITISSISLQGGGSDVVFNQITGDTNQYGTLIVKQSSTTLGQKTLTITKPGIVSSN